jgi:hypothetical protein
MPKKASKIPEFARLLPVFDMKITLFIPPQPHLFAPQDMEALKQPRGAEAGPAHLIGYALGTFFNANFCKLFNEFFIANVLTRKLGLQEAPGPILPFHVNDHIHTVLRE